MRNRYMMLAGFTLLLTLPVSAPASPPSAEQGGGGASQFAFWYEDWKENTWEKLQPANTIIGVPPKAVGDIHAHGGRALAYITFYQSVLDRAFLHDKADLQNVGFHTPQSFLPSAFGGKDNYVLCSNSTELRRRTLAYVDRTIGQQGYDGLFIDNSYLPPAADLVCDAKHAHVTPGEKGGPAFVDLMSDVYAAAKKRNPAAIIMTNPGNPRGADQLRSGSKTLWDVSDYVLWESYGYSSLLGQGHDRWQATVAQSRAVSSSPHAQKVVALAYPRNFQEALYSFVIARSFGFQFAANTGESVAMGHFGIFLQDLPMALGAPQTPAAQERAPGVLDRRYSNGEVIANTTSSPWSFKASRDADLYSSDGRSEVKAGKQVTVSPGAAVALSFH